MKKTKPTSPRTFFHRRCREWSPPVSLSCQSCLHSILVSRYTWKYFGTSNGWIGPYRLQFSARQKRSYIAHTAESISLPSTSSVLPQTTRVAGYATDTHSPLTMGTLFSTIPVFKVRPYYSFRSFVQPLKGTWSSLIRFFLLIYF